MVIDRDTTSRDAKSLADGAYLRVDAEFSLLVELVRLHSCPSLNTDENPS